MLVLVCCLSLTRESLGVSHFNLLELAIDRDTVVGRGKVKQTSRALFNLFIEGNLQGEKIEGIFSTLKFPENKEESVMPHYIPSGMTLGEALSLVLSDWKIGLVQIEDKLVLSEGDHNFLLCLSDKFLNGSSAFKLPGDTRLIRTEGTPKGFVSLAGSKEEFFTIWYLHRAWVLGWLKSPKSR